MPRRLSPTILVVGGGFAGRSALRHLIANANNTHIILIDEKPFFEFTTSTLRCIVHPGHIRRITFNQHSDPGIIFLQGRVTCMTDREATVSRREGDRVTAFAVPFDFCVWATGADYAQPIRTTYWGNNPTVLRRRGEFGYFHHKIIASTHILVLGAGPIGVELTAELIALCKNTHTTRFTLAASPRGVLSRLPKRAGLYATKWLTERGVCILYARLKKGTHLTGGHFHYTDPTDPAVTISPDLVFDCTGARNNGATSVLIAGGLCDDSLLQRDGSLMVLDTLQLPNAPHIFVAGDAHRVPGELDLGELACEKTAYAAESAGQLAARNVITLVRSDRLLIGGSRRLHRYPVDAFPMSQFPRLFVVSLYKYHGILCIGPLVLTGVLAAVVKLMIEVLGVSAAKQDSLFSMVFRVMEGVAYLLATLFTFISAQFQRRRRFLGTVSS